MTTRDPRGRRTKHSTGLMVAVGLAILAPMIVLPAVAGSVGDVESAMRALDQEYEERSAVLPEGPDQTALDLEYEKAREQLLIALGAVAPNGPNPSPQPGEDEPNIHPDGIHEANEDPEGYLLTNFWVHEFEDGEYIYVMGASVDGDPDVGGVYVMDARGEEFFAAPSKVGALTVKSVDGSLVTLLDEAGGVYLFDYETREWPAP